MSGKGAKQAPFSGKAVGWLAGVSAVSLLAAFLVPVFGPELMRKPSVGSDADSVSALGHRALATLLKRLDVPVVVSRGGSGAKAKNGGLLVVAEPDVGEQGDERWTRLADLIGSGTRNHPLLVLPKRSGTRDSDRDEWIAEAWLLGAPHVQRVLRATNFPGVVLRPEENLTTWRMGDFGPQPTLYEPQLLAPPRGGFEPVVSCDQGVLLARYEDPPMYVLSDPDLLSTHGLATGDNAALTVAILDALRDGGGVVIDETLHGVEKRPGVWYELFRFPLGLTVVQACLAAAVLLLAAMARFGAPVPTPRAIEAGKRFMIENTAGLLHLGRHSAYSLDRYLSAAVQDVARLTHAPANLDREGVLAWVTRAERARGAPDPLAGLQAEAAAIREEPDPDPERVVGTASRIHRWRVRTTGEEV